MQNQPRTDSGMRPTAPAGGLMPDTEALQGPAAGTYRGSELASDLLTRLFYRLPFKLTLRLWNGAAVQVGAGDSAARESPFALVFRNPEVVWSAVRSEE